MLIVAVFCTIAAKSGIAETKISVAQAFYTLAHQNNVSKIESLLHRGYSIESKDKNGYNSVCLAVSKQDKKAYNTLISYGATPKPACLKEIPESSYYHFFGVYPQTETTAAYLPDKPYLIGTAALAAGAVTAAYLLRGNTDGSGSGSGSGEGGDNPSGGENPPTPPTPTECQNGTIVNGKCVCNNGYYLWEGKCQPMIRNCVEQSRPNVCQTCADGYLLNGDKSVCNAKILNCRVQNGTICEQCETGFGVHKGDGRTCFADIQYCGDQEKDVCKTCVAGYGQHGNERKCYKNIENCIDQVQTSCKNCAPGFDTYGDPEANFCYPSNPCVHPNTVPVNHGERCECDENRGYTGEPGSCVQVEEGDYQEGEGSRDEWNNLNELHCNSHGEYLGSGQCRCYVGYTGETTGCSTCASGYLDFNGVCYQDLQCETRYGEAYMQENNRCTCKVGYVSFAGQCYAEQTCPLHYEQSKDQCKCKRNFDENCEQCIEGYEYDAETDTCLSTGCEEKWGGENCDVCPLKFEITYDEDGKPHCGNKCAINRAPWSEDNPECNACAEGYDFSPADDTCIVTNCSSGVEGYIKDESGKCVCDEANGYVMTLLKICQKKGEDLIGLKESNINNSVINVTNDGELRDVYGMKPFIESAEEGGEKTYYDSVYNASATNNNQNGTINIINKNSGANYVYGIFAPSDIYNASVTNAGKNNVTAEGKINITDERSFATIFGIYNDAEKNTYNAFTYGSGEGKANEPIQNKADGSIIITRSEESEGVVTGILGNNLVYNAYARTNEGIAANVFSQGSIQITHEGKGDVIGIQQNNPTGKVTNSYAHLNSPVSDAKAVGSIILKGKNNVYGIMSKSSVTNSETQFDKSYSKIGEFSSIGTIDVTTSNDNRGAAYGIYLDGSSDIKSEIYNAMGYNSIGNIIASNTSGGSAYGIYSNAGTYNDPVEVNEDGSPVVYYNNTYNAFRSSAKYGGDNAATRGNVTINIDGKSFGDQKGVGIYAKGNVFNSYANSGSDTKLETIGNITINDKSQTSNISLYGIQSGGATIANAYSTGQNRNDKTNVTGNININIMGNKGGAGTAAGIYTNIPTSKIAKIYNAALINDQNSVSGNITVQSGSVAALNRMYGIYASSYDVNGGNEGDGQPKNVYNAYYENSDEISAGSVHGEINVIAERKSEAPEAEYYGIYVNNGEAYNAYSTNENADVTGVINVNIVGANNKALAAGMYGNNARLYNSGKSEINVTTLSNNSTAYGIKGDKSYIYNDAALNVNSRNYDAYGIYVNQGTVINDTNGVINVTGKGNNYGIYAISDGTGAGKVDVVNNGTIKVSGGNSNIGIYAEGKTATVSNTGTIILGEGDTCTGADCNGGSYIVLNNDATFDNSGTLTSIGSLNFDAMGGNVQISKGGKFEAEDNISGTLNVASNVVTNNFDRQSVVADALSAEDISNVNLKSKSYLYNANVKQNENGKYDIVMDMKDLSTVFDADTAAYYDLNYDNSKNMELFDILKDISTAKEARQRDADIRGTSVLPNMTDENLKVMRSLDRTMMGELFKEGDDVRKMVGGDWLYLGREDHGTLSGYDINSQSMYALYDQKLDNKYRMGLGLSFTHADTDYNNDSSRKNFMVQGYVPLTYTNGKGLTAVSMARLGYSDGDYKRRGYNHTYEADTNEITYGLLNELRYKINLGGIDITPFIGLNAIGWYQDSIHEGDENLAINIASSHVFSLESALGVYLDKEIEFSQDDKLSMALGLGYYHEFADPYRGFTARHGGDSIGHYKLRDIENLNSRNRGILSAKINYDYKDFSIYGELMQYLEEEYPIKVDVGLKYKF